MKYSVIFMLLIFPVMYGLAEDSKPDTKTQLISNLSKIESVYIGRLSGKELQEAVRLLNETRGLIVGLQATQTSSNQDVIDNLLSEDGFQALAKSVRKENIDRHRSKVIIATLGKRGRITMAQVGILVQLYSNDDEKRDLLIAIHDSIIDPVNISLALQSFVISSYRDQVLDAYQD